MSGESIAPITLFAGFPWIWLTGRPTTAALALHRERDPDVAEQASPAVRPEGELDEVDQAGHERLPEVGHHPVVAGRTATSVFLTCRKVERSAFDLQVGGLTCCEGQKAYLPQAGCTVNLPPWPHQFRHRHE
jgi:hypothetical protein